VVVPPLRERPDDLSLLIDHFLDHFSKRVGGVRKRLSAKVSEMLLDHPWPGNVRQLRNVIESGVVLSLGEEIGIDDLSLNRQSKPDESPEKWQARSLQELEREHIERMLDHVGWNKKRAAELLGIERSTLYSRLRNHGIRPKERS
ncbi:MAG TPA: sigma-54-dependent Fis family transcriptional regulator, partial [Planctomycetes bacterium]|nr:sigma-54-dependent Fis family transcriptional regulator [Planctomycetota bacterium]